LTAPRRPWLGPLGRDHLFGQPHRQAAALAQRSIIFGPVRYPMLLFRDVVTAIGIGLEGHGPESQRITDREAPSYVGFCRPRTAAQLIRATRSCTAQRARSSSRRRMLNSALRRLPSRATGRHQAPPPETVEYPSFRAGGRGLFKMRRRPVMTYCVINGVGRMSCRIGRWVFAKLAVSSNSWGCLLGLLAQSQALS